MDPDFEEPLDGIAVQLQLVDRLAGADLAQLGGRSAVSKISGTRAWCASITAGARFAAAVPDVQVTATGRLEAFAAPTAKNPAQRSSICDQQWTRGSRTSESTTGVDREPGDVHACPSPHRASSSQNARSSRYVDVAVMIQSPEMAPTLVLLHGFTHTGASWAPVMRALGERYSAIAPDIRGHGSAAEREPVNLEGVIADIVGMLGDEHFSLAGYSMGGRIALHAALALSGRVDRLILIGASPGIADALERRARGEDDQRLADWIERARDIEQVARRWGRTPVLAHQPPDVRGRAHEDRLRNTPGGLARALRGLGPGALPPVWDRLGELRMPVVLVAGERDQKYVAISERMAERIPNARVMLVPGAGHAVHLEAPALVAHVIAEA